MTDTANLGLPLLQPSQAQKHVTVNEALIRIDALSQLNLQSRTTHEPPLEALDGSCYAVPTGAAGAWLGKDEQLAIASNGGWIFIPPQNGWRGWVTDECREVTYLAGSWQSGVLATSARGAASRFFVDEVEYQVDGTAGQEIPIDIPASEMLFACSARVSFDIQGTLTSWSLGFSDEPEKFGTGMGLTAGSYCTGILSQPTTYYSLRRPYLTAVGGEFSSGALIVAVHRYRIELPI